jgi:hypothetical protein
LDNAKNAPLSESEDEIVAIGDGRAPLGKAVPSWESGAMVLRGDSKASRQNLKGMTPK